MMSTFLLTKCISHNGMKKKFAFSNLAAYFFICSASLFSQDLYLPYEFRQAVEEGTRTLTGVPGPGYWINRSDYNMSVRVDFVNDTAWISGTGEITYYNNSPDSLRQIVLRSYPDIYSKGSLRDFYFGGLDDIPMVHYSDVFINEDTIPPGMMYGRRTSTNIIVGLEQAVAPGAKAVIRIKWKYMMYPYVNIRQGVYDRKFLFVAYWYPQVAVYDDLFGWDMIDYRGMVEFYNDFNSYDVRITLPSEYFVWGGGVLQNPSEVYPENILEKYQAALKSNEVINILSLSDLPDSTVSGKEKTWHFTSERSPDFTFAVSKSHLWDASSIDVGEARRVLVSSVYPPESRYYSAGATWARESVDYLSRVCPGVPYPWPRMTVFNSMEGNGAMESPMMVNTGDQGSAGYAREVVFHEIAHTIIPFYLGANERRFAWMDEGWATYQDSKWSEANSGDEKDMFEIIFDQVAGTTMDVPLMVPTYQFTDQTAETFHAYVRSSQAFAVIEDQLGLEKMNQAWKLFTLRWNGKHPAPWDLFATFSDVAGEDLSWLIGPWYYQFAFADLAITKVDPGNRSVKIENKGGLPLPVYLNIKYNDGTTETIHRKPDIFRSGSVATLKTGGKKEIESIELDHSTFFDADHLNDKWEK